MFTIKWIKSNGEELIYPARGISFTPGDVQRSDPKKATVKFTIPEGEAECSIDTGRVYVMNANGRTVADYVLETADFPHGMMPRTHTSEWKP